MDRVDAVVIGAGVVGAAIAYDFASCGVTTLVLESAAGPAAGASGANAGILDTGFGARPESFEGSMALAQGQRWQTVFNELKIPYVVCGAMLIASDAEQAGKLELVASNAETNGVKVRVYDRNQIRHVEPRAKAAGGLLVPGEAITDPYEMVSRLLAAGPTVRYGAGVIGVEPHQDGALVRCESGDVIGRFVINCAGLFSDDIAGDASFTIKPRRGEFVVLPEEAATLTDHIIFPMSSPETKDLTIFPTLYGHLCAGATTADQDDKTDWKVRPEGSAAVHAAAAALIPKIADFKPVDTWAGLRAVGHPRNYIAEWSKRVPAMFNVAGIAFAGLSTCLGLSAYVLDRCRERGLNVKPRTPKLSKTAANLTFPWWQRRKR